MTNLFRSAAGAMLAIVASAGILAGCSDNASSPLPPNSDPLGNNATVKTSDPVPSSEANAVRENVRKNANDSIAVLPNEAAEIAMDRYPGAEVYAVNLDYDRDSVNYETIVRSNGNVYAVTVDPQTGQVIEERQINNYYYTTIIVVPPTTVRPRQACERARRIANGDVVEVNIESIESRTTYVIIILMPDNRYTTLYIDAESGRERRLQNGGDCELRQGDDDGEHRDRHKNKKGKGHYRHGKGKGYGHYYHCECECTDDDGQELPTGVISLDSAASIARSYFTDTVRVTKVEIEVEDSTNIFYDVSLRGFQAPDTNEYEVRLNARTGALVSITQTKGDLDSAEFRPRVGGDTLVALSVARAAAIANTAGAVQSWTLEYDQAEAKWVYAFEILTAANVRTTVVVDARTGTFIRIR